MIPVVLGRRSILACQKAMKPGTLSDMGDHAREGRGFLQPKSWSRASHQPRFETIRPYVEGRSVLDLGCATGHSRPDWLHGAISDAASEAVGVDLDQRKIDLARAQGYPLIRGDAETVRLDRTFEVVFAGELLEHLTCFTQFFDTVRAHLDPGGSLVLTTPNAFGVSNFVYRLGGAVRVNDDHTCWFCRDTLRQLLAKNGFTMEQLTYLRSESPSRGRRSLARIVRAPLPEQLAWNTLVAMAKPT